MISRVIAAWRTLFMYSVRFAIISAEFLVAEEGHMAVAYLVCTAHHGRWAIEEAGDRDPSGARIGAMLQVMLARNPGELPRLFRRLLFRRLFALGLLALHERLDFAQRRLERRVMFDFRLHGRDFAQSPCGRQ